MVARFIEAEEHEQHIGYSRFIENVEQAEAFLDETGVSLAAECWADAAILLLEEAYKLLADDGPRGLGARTADVYRASLGRETVEQLRIRAVSIQFGAAEATAITGGLVEEAEAG